MTELNNSARNGNVISTSVLLTPDRLCFIWTSSHMYAQLVSIIKTIILRWRKYMVEYSKSAESAIHILSKIVEQKITQKLPKPGLAFLMLTLI